MRRGYVRAVALLLSLIASSAQAAEPLVSGEAAEVVVIGRLPGPPLWKVSGDGRALWILPYLDLIPDDLGWDSELLERVITESEEFISLPQNTRDMTTANPVTLIRVLGLIREVTHLPKGQSLSDILPPELYGRFLALAARYSLPGEHFEDLAPMAVKSELSQEILAQENLSSMRPVMNQISKWVKRNRTIRITDPSQVISKTPNFREMKALIERQNAAKTSEGAIACLERHIAYFENALPFVRERGQSWAQGYVHDLLFDTDLQAREMICRKASAPDLAEEVDEIERARKISWLSAAETALKNNQVTFAVLAVNDILAPDGLVAQLRMKGYDVAVSAKNDGAR